MNGSVTTQRCLLSQAEEEDAVPGSRSIQDRSQSRRCQQLAGTVWHACSTSQLPLQISFYRPRRVKRCSGADEQNLSCVWMSRSGLDVQSHASWRICWPRLTSRASTPVVLNRRLVISLCQNARCWRTAALPRLGEKSVPLLNRR